MLPLELLREIAVTSRVREAARIRRSCVVLSNQISLKDLVHILASQLIRNGKHYKYVSVESYVMRMSEDTMSLLIQRLVNDWGPLTEEMPEEDALVGIFNLAISKGFTGPTKMLLDYGFTWVDHSLRPLKTCLDNERAEIFEMLMEGVDLDKEDDGAIAFGAGCTGSVAILRVIMHRCSLRNRNYALCSATRAVKLEGLELLVNSGWRLTFDVDNGQFAHELMGGGLAKAVAKGEVDRVELIVRGITNVNWGEQEDKPLFNGIEAGQVRCIQILLDNGASITQSRIHEAVWGAERAAIESLQSAFKAGIAEEGTPEFQQFWRLVWAEVDGRATHVDAVAKLKVEWDMDIPEVRRYGGLLDMP
ncbi:hypothetical protein HK104_003150, partial [Borealophlyctis nickersoniae]